MMKHDFEDMGAAARFLEKVGLLVRVSEDDENRMRIGKPTGLPGRNLPGYEVFWASTDVRLACPMVTICLEKGKWTTSVREYRPGPGPGDFTQECSNLGESVHAALKWFGLTT